MNKEIPFNTVMKDPRSWSDKMNVDNMMENHLKLKPIMDKMFFTEWPKHPQYFVLMFSREDFADTLINCMLKSGITNLNKVWFTEYGEEDKQKLIEMGVLDTLPMALGLSAISYGRSGEDYYVGAIF